MLKMPQMKPMNWMLLFMMMSLTILMMNIWNFFYLMYISKNLTMKKKKKNYNWKW